MGKTAKNISIVLGLITIAFAGYYLYTIKGDSTLNLGSGQELDQNTLNNTQVFIQHRQTLSEVKLNIELFEDDRFTSFSLLDFSVPIEARPIGRPDPFAEPAISPAANF